jgi:hypothetical protein
MDTTTLHGPWTSRYASPSEGYCLLLILLLIEK